ncbi:hypothetical protein QR680_007054 [Steinernema hermaphroditum]|uniref:Autophagy-related protein n=1 Tax=Steinernema hermaphroditum TaxID=289476 RepID=A0AA39LY59_9BILA|nr:hypothetical protein QR680_007054 [Steinernema hermaphroditum]
MPNVYEPNYKERRMLSQRKRLFAEVTQKNPGKIPLIIERLRGEKYLPVIDRCQFLVTETTTVAELTAVIRRRLVLTSDQSLVIFINEKTIPSPLTSMWKLYEDERDEDGFMYVTYSSQSYFGC